MSNKYLPIFSCFAAPAGDASAPTTTTSVTSIVSVAEEDPVVVAARLKAEAARARAIQHGMDAAVQSRDMGLAALQNDNHGDGLDHFGEAKRQADELLQTLPKEEETEGRGVIIIQWCFKLRKHFYIDW